MIFKLMSNSLGIRFLNPTQTPTQNLKSRFSMFTSQEIGSRLVSLEMIFEAQQSSAQAIQIQV